MGCLGYIATIILFSAGIERLDKNTPLSIGLIAAAIVVGLITWFIDRKDDGYTE